MLRLRTFGSPAVEGEGVAARGAATQRKALALLALLAAAGDRGLSRDKLLAYLWRETGPDRAPHRLNQALYALRRDLHQEELFLGSTKLRLNPEIISSDVAGFRAAHEAGELERAVDLYGGPFLDGFSVRDAPEFERWVEAERADLARACDEALEALAAAAMAAGNHVRAATWWRRLGDRDPYSSRVTIHLMHALAAAGKRAEALKTARTYQELMAEELGAAPSPAVEALADQLRHQPAAPSLTASPLLGGVGSIAILPFAILGSKSSLGGFSEGLAEELMSAVARLPGLRVVSRTSVEGLRNSGLEAREIGKRLGAALLLEGSVRLVGSRVRVTANLVSTEDGLRLSSQTLEQSLDDPFHVQEELARTIVAGIEAAVSHRPST